MLLAFGQVRENNLRILKATLTHMLPRYCTGPSKQKMLKLVSRTELCRYPIDTTKATMRKALRMPVGLLRKIMQISRKLKGQGRYDAARPCRDVSNFEGEISLAIAAVAGALEPFCDCVTEDLGRRHASTRVSNRSHKLLNSE